jgi:hypothetical protein
MTERRSEEWYAEQGDGIERRCLCPFADPDDDCTRPEEHERPRMIMLHYSEESDPFEIYRGTPASRTNDGQGEIRNDDQGCHDD